MNFTSPQRKAGRDVIDGRQLWSAEDVAKLFTKDLVGHSVSMGVGGYYDRLVTLNLKVDSAGLSNLAKWEEIFRKGIHYDAKRIKMIAQRLASLARVEDVLYGVVGRQRLAIHGIIEFHVVYVGEICVQRVNYHF
ncbi:unnamed protein product, partial [Mesorhabditis belari]|uniref:Uncharacterized protein n=1 Tax=Mesorhabditis belari TaxID=2138241 RepID=A0AAF3J9G4_9BILA